MCRYFFILALYMPALCNAQNKFDFGLSTPILFRRAQAHSNMVGHLHLFGLTGINGTLWVNGTEETDISFVMNAGIYDDMRKYSTSVDTRVSNSLYFVNINPSVVIPSKWQHIQFCIGIGTLIRLGQDVAFSWHNSGIGGGTSIDSMNNLLNDNARNIIPYISFGIADDITKHLKLELTIQPTLLNFYEPGTNINFTYNTGTSSGGTNLELNYQPVYVGLQLFYFFRGSYN